VNFVAVKMLTGDRTKYVGLIFAISVPSMLMAHQASIFARRRDLGHGPDATSANLASHGDGHLKRAGPGQNSETPLASRVEPIPCGAETVTIHISRQHSVVTMPPPSAT